MDGFDQDEACCECDLLLKATRGVTIAVVSSRERKRRQPGLATDDPAFVGWQQLVRGESVHAASPPKPSGPTGYNVIAIYKSDQTLDLEALFSDLLVCLQAQPSYQRFYQHRRVRGCSLKASALSA